METGIICNLVLSYTSVVMMPRVQIVCEKYPHSIFISVFNKHYRHFLSLIVIIIVKHYEAGVCFL